MMLLQTATINEYCYSNENNETTTTDKWSLQYKWQTEIFTPVVFLIFKLLSRI